MYTKNQRKKHRENIDIHNEEREREDEDEENRQNTLSHKRTTTTTTTKTGFIISSLIQYLIFLVRLDFLFCFDII